jgi:predicted chitinase
MQLTWKANYEAASKDLYGDDRLVQKPQVVAEDEAIAWATAFYYWKTRVHTAPGVKEGKFGATTKAINGALECGAPNDKAKKRFANYSKILTTWGISDKPDETGCYN